MENTLEYDPLRELLGNIVRCQLKSGKLFCARLIVVKNNDELWFENRSGQKILNRRDSIEWIVPITKVIA